MAEQRFLTTLGDMLDLMSKLSEGDYLKGADMCMDIKRLVNEMKGNVVYINMTRGKGCGITHAQKLASGRHHICKVCGIIVGNDSRSIEKHELCITHIRRLHQDRLLQRGIPFERVNDIIKLKHKSVVNECRYEKLYEFTIKHIENVSAEN